MGMTWIRWWRALAGLCGAVLLAQLHASTSAGAEAADPRVSPGATITFEFPDFGKTWDGQETATMQVYVPADYSLDRSFPLLAWFEGGAGGSSADRPRRITGGRGFVCVGLPYRWQEPGDGMSGGSHVKRDEGWATQWSRYEPMMATLKKAIPNIDPRKRVVMGFSSGGACIGTHIDRGDRFMDFFCAFGLAGYGSWPRKIDGLKGRPVLLYCGENDERLAGNKRAKPLLERVGADVEEVVFTGFGHAMAEPFFPKMLDWLNRKVVFAGLREEAQKMRAFARARRWTEALRHVRSVLKIARPGMEEHAEARRVLAQVSPKGDEALAKLLGRGTPSEKNIRKFVDDWPPCPCADKARELADDIGRKKLKGILSLSGYQRSSKLRGFLSDWEGFPVYREALDAYEKDAAKALTALETQHPNVRRLSKFVEKWSPAPSAARALEMLEGLAAGDLAKILETKSARSRRSKLKSFMRSYKGTETAAQARDALAALTEAEAREILTRIKTKRGNARKSMLRSFVKKYAGTKAAEEAKRLLDERPGRR